MHEALAREGTDPAAVIYQEQFKSALGLKKHPELLSEEQRRIVEVYKELE